MVEVNFANFITVGLMAMIFIAFWSFVKRALGMGSGNDQ